MEDTTVQQQGIASFVQLMSPPTDSYNLVTWTAVTRVTNAHASSHHVMAVTSREEEAAYGT